ncbi:zinc finger domain-containing protein [Colletotrichum asianum]
MDKPNNGGRLRVTELPVETLRIILSHSGDIGSLDSTVHSCGTLFRAFYAFPAPIVTAIVQREIGKDLLFEAARFTRALDLLRSQDRVVVANVSFAEFLRRDQETPHHFRWTLHEAYSSLSLRIESEIFARIQSIHPHVEIKPASSTELLRIQRALYRFETYRILFPQHQDLEHDYPDYVDDLDGGMKAQMQFLAGSPP